MGSERQFTTHEAYIEAARPEVRQSLLRIGDIVRQHVPLAEPCISYGMPAFRIRRVFFYFAAFRKHIGVYPPVTDDLLLIEALKPFRNQKGNLAFPLDRPIPYNLIGRVADALAAQYAPTDSLRT